MELDEAPSDESLLYYYHFFKASHATVNGDFKVAEKHYGIAESLLENIQDPIEKQNLTLSYLATIIMFASLF